MKKLLSISLAALMALTLLAGCTPSTGGTDTPAAATEDAKAATAAPAASATAAATESKAPDAADAAADTSKEVTLKWLQIGAAPKDQALVLEEINKYLKEKINVKLEMTNYDWGDYDTKAKLAINSGEDFDIFFTCSWAADYTSFAAQGAFLRLDDPENNLLEKYGKEMVALINPAFFKGCTINGGIYTIPTNKELGYQAVWSINKPVADKYGIKKEDFNDVASVIPLLEKVKAGEGDKYFPSKIDWNWLSGNRGTFEGIDCDVGVAYTPGTEGPDDYKVFSMIKSDDFKNYVKLTREAYQKGLTNPDMVPEVNDVATAMDKSGNWLLGSYHYMPLGEISDSAAKGYEVQVNPIHPAITATWSTTGSTNAISVNSQNPERAMMFLNLVNSDPTLRQLLGYGIEGTHYTLDAQGAMIRTKEQADAYAPPNFALGNVMITKLSEGEPADKWDQFKAFNDSCKDSPILGFVLNKDPIANEIAALKNVEKEYKRTLCFGSVDPDVKLPEYISKLEAAGLQKVIDEMQKQVDAFKATK